MVPLIIEAVRELDVLFQQGKITANEKYEHTTMMFRQIQTDMNMLTMRITNIEQELSLMKEKLLDK